MKMFSCLLAFLLVMSLALPALSEDELDVIGIYFDPAGLEYEGFVGAEELLDVYIILHNPSRLVVTGFEFSYIVDTMGAEHPIFRTLDQLPPQSVR